MAKELLVGPLLGIESDTQYTVCFLAKSTLAGFSVLCDGVEVIAQEIAQTHSGRFWRAVLPIEPRVSAQSSTYSIKSNDGACKDMFDREEWTFFVPRKAQDRENLDLRIAYASCNGFSKKPSGGDDDYVLWDNLERSHARRPYSLLIMGGDQLYADQIWTSDQCKSIQRWREQSTNRRIQATATQTMKRELGRFYESLYLNNWRKRTMSKMMASIPSVMMWDDHDIIDGWGSHPDEIQECEVYQAIYAAAAQHFELFQIRSKQNTTLLDSSAKHYSFGLRFRGYSILGLDNRAERTLNQVMSSDNWRSVKDWLAKQEAQHHTQPGVNPDTLLVMSAIPVVYRSFAGVEAVMGATPWEESLEDDVNDHWTADRHEGEREKLITILLDHKNRCRADGERRVVILSGDVHVGSLGVIDDQRNPNRHQKIHQVVSSGIVHPTVGWFAWQGLTMVTGDSRERLKLSEVYTENICPIGGSKFIRARNYANLQLGSDDNLWVEWISPKGDRHEYGIPMNMARAVAAH